MTKPFFIGKVKIDPPLLQAPLAGFTTWAFRTILRSFGGAGLIFSEMISARGYFEQQKRGFKLAERLFGIAEEPYPVAVQIWDNNPTLMSEVAHSLVHQSGVDLIDVNFGCPAPEVAQKGESGAWLLRSPERIGRILQQMVAACHPVPVTAKIRLGVDNNHITAHEVAQAVEEAGSAALTVHGRTACQMYRGRADWEAIARIRPFLKRIPLIGNGDIRTPADAVKAFEYPVDGVMIGRTGISKPWIFREAASLLCNEPLPPSPQSREIAEILNRHHQLLLLQYDPQKAMVLLRKIACRYCSGFPEAKKLRSCAAHLESQSDLDQLLTSLRSELV